MQNKKLRQSNIELLRILSMVMVLGLHSNFKALGLPQVTSASNIVFFSLLECCCICAVNVFILISGYFGGGGTALNLKKLGGFLFQCFFILFLVYIFWVFIGKTHLDLKGMLSCFCLAGNGWFVVAYIGLYILSPIINKYFDSLSKKDTIRVVVSYGGFLIIWGWLGNGVQFNSGYSILILLLLYMIGRYIRIYDFKLPKPLLLFLLSVIILTGLICYSIYYYNGVGVYRLLNYICPFVIFESICLFKFFQNYNLKTNKYINWISGSVFGVYLIQDVAPLNEKLYIKLSKYIFDNYSSFQSVINITILIFTFFWIGVLIDKLRLLIWNKIIKI